jgi:hypothetical protein
VSDDLARVSGHEQLLTEPGAPQQPANAGEHLQVLSDRSGYKKEEQLNRLLIDCAKRYSLGLPTEHDHRTADQAGERGARVWQCNPIANACTVERFAVAQGT